MSNNWREKWAADIDFLKENLIRGHANLFFSISKDEFEEKVKELKSIIDKLDYDDMKVEISRLVASIGDAHTSIAFPISNYLPVKFYIFKDGVYVTKVNSEYKELLYKKVTAIEGMAIELVLKEVSTIISHENEYFLKAQSAKYLQAVDLLYGLYICDNKEVVNIEVEGKNIPLKTVPISKLDYIKIDKLPRHEVNRGLNYWFESSDDEVYIKYNSCREDGIRLIKEKIEDTIKFIETNNIKKITIDLRNNLGGDSSLIQPLIEYVKSNSSINKKESLKIIIGRETFSSALLNAYQFKFETNAKIVGEPSGGKPNCYGEVLRFTLPNSKFSVTYSTKYFRVIQDDDVLALYPDEWVEENIEDYRLLNFKLFS